MLRAYGLKRGVRAPREAVWEALCRRYGLEAGRLREKRIVRESLDARKKGDLFFLHTVDFALETAAAEEKLLRRKGAAGKLEASPQEGYALQGGPVPAGSPRPLVVGFGPCGIFAALALARMGRRPLVLERGAAMEARTAAVERFWQTGVLDPKSNVQFGEGGAGAFSDGKLTTRIKDPRIHFVLEALIAAGAPEEIRFQQRPHIGTDLLKEVVTALRREIEALGGEVRFESCVTDLKTEDGALRAILVNGTEEIPAAQLIFAPGHSARDSFRMLQSRGLAMAQKPFSMGLRVEHLQREITLAQYGEETPFPADYQLSLHTADGRGVYTFCMCPGGYVVAAASEEGRLVTNGMSYHSRAGENANSALLVDVRPEDFGGPDPLAGVRFQEQWEETAYHLGGGGYRAPAQRMGDFLAGRAEAGPMPESPLQPTYRPGVRWCAVDDCLPPFVSAAMREAIPQMARQLRGFDCPEAILTGIESRSSSPVRLLRDKESLQSNIRGLYPAGEGAGYAGGIVSSAVDGIRAAEALTASLSL